MMSGEVCPDGIEVNGWVKITSFDKRRGVFSVDMRDRYLAYVKRNIIGLECKREYITSQRTYRIFLQNKEVREGNKYFGVWKHSEQEAYSTEIDWGFQTDMRGAIFDTLHVSCHGRAGHWQHHVRCTGRNTVRSDDGHSFQSAGQTAYTHNASYPRGCYGGGIRDDLDALGTNGAAESHGFVVTGPEGQSRGHYSSQANDIRTIDIWIYVRPCNIAY